MDRQIEFKVIEGKFYIAIEVSDYKMMDELVSKIKKVNNNMLVHKKNSETNKNTCEYCNKTFIKLNGLTVHKKTCKSKTVE